MQVRTLQKQSFGEKSDSYGIKIDIRRIANKNIKANLMSILDFCVMRWFTGSIYC